MSTSVPPASQDAPADEPGADNSLSGTTTIKVPEATTGSFTYERRDITQFKQQIEIFEAKARAITTAILMVLGGLSILGVIGACLYVIVKQGYPATTVATAEKILVAFIGVLFGFFAGQLTKK